MADLTPTVRLCGFVLVTARDAYCRAIDIAVDPGLVLLVSGQNGVGKSTLLRVLLGQHHRYTGIAEVLGVDCRQSRRIRRLSIGYSDQAASTFSHMTPFQNVALGVAGTKSGQQNTRVADSLERFGLPANVWHQRGILSGGQVRRVSLARAFADDNELVLLDEPESGLDQAGLAELNIAIAEATARSATVVVVTHSPARYGDIRSVLVDLSDSATREMH